MGWFDRTVDDLPPGVRTGKPNPQLTGADGGHDISSRTVAREGVRLLGRLEGIRDGVAYFVNDLAENLAWADNQARQLLRDIDAVVERQGLECRRRIQRRGITEIPGLYVLGLDWLHSAKSGLFAGIDEDATYLASAMATTR